MKRDLIIDVVAGGGPHFVEHLAPVYRALPETMRGSFFTDPAYFTAAVNQAGSVKRAEGAGDFWLVCSYGDLVFANLADPQRPVIFMEHGAGFTFEGSDGVPLSSYSGSPDRPNVVLFLNVNEYPQQRNAEEHPFAAQAVIGSPKMDRWYPARPTGNSIPRIGVTFHWDCLVAPGTRSALPYYRDALFDLVADVKRRGWEIVCHGHPRIHTEMKFLSLELDIPFVEQLDTVFETCDLLVADATSAMYEFASLDRPVVSLNCPPYYEEADDGIRFWQHIPGLIVDDPSTLKDMVPYALADGADTQELRRAAIDVVYPIRGNAAETAAREIQQFINRDGGLVREYDGPNLRLRDTRARQQRLRDRIRDRRRRVPNHKLAEVIDMKDASRKGDE